MYESVSDWGDCVWVFWVFRGFKVDYRVFYGFWVGCMSVGPLQGDLWVLGIFGGLFRGLRGGLCHFFVVSVILIVIVIILIILCSDLL